MVFVELMTGIKEFISCALMSMTNFCSSQKEKARIDLLLEEVSLASSKVTNGAFATKGGCNL
jgi:hypothetical protein